MHHIFGMMLNGELLLAPIENPHRVLDLGTGTGIWAIDFADKYPSAEVIGCDLSPIQPSWVPSVVYHSPNYAMDLLIVEGQTLSSRSMTLNRPGSG
jgi:tRNA1(Val) A37 N6-methylase TrmN6